MKYDVVIIGGGLSGMTAAAALQKAGLRCVVVSEGGCLVPGPVDEYTRAGGVLLPGDSAVRGVFNPSGHLSHILTRNLGITRLEAEHFILATGRFFSKGLVATMDEIYEPVFGCDVQYDRARDRWIDHDFYAVQPFENFGVMTDGQGLVSIRGERIDNLYAVGEILCGSPDIVESALKVARQIIEGGHHAE